MLVATLALAPAFGGCSKTLSDKIVTSSQNFQASVAAINGNIAAIAPTVAARCADVQKWAMLIAPFVPDSGKAQQYFGAANGALQGYCSDVPSDIGGTAVALAKAATAAKAGYDDVSRK